MADKDIVFLKSRRIGEKILARSRVAHPFLRKFNLRGNGGIKFCMYIYNYPKT